MKKNVSVLYCSILLILGFGCASSPTGSDAPAVLTAGWSKTDAAPGSCMLRSGATVEIRLDANATTGYSWQFTPSGDPDVVVLEKHFYSVPESSRDLCGAPGTDVWRFRAAKKGRAVLTFRYFRQWQKFDPAHDAERAFTVVVTE